MEAIFIVFLLVLAPVLYYLLKRRRHPGKVAEVPLPAGSVVQARRGSAPDAKSIRILVAEDNAVSARILDAFLDRMGCSATLTADGEEALRVACAQKYALAIVDLSMPEMNGFEFALQYRRQEGDADHLPIIALTADAPEKVSDKCLSAGMDDILGKPIMYDQLLAIVQQYARRPPGLHISPGAVNHASITLFVT